MSGNSRTFRLAAWGAAFVAFAAWQYYDKKHPKEFKSSEVDAWNERVKRESALGSKPPQSGSSSTSSSA